MGTAELRVPEDLGMQLPIQSLTLTLFALARFLMIAVAAAFAVAGSASATGTLPVLDPADVQYAAKKVTVWGGQCEAATMSYSRWEGFPVTLCEYNDVGATVKTFMLNADRERLARWIVTACKDASVSKLRPCIRHMAGITSEAASGNIYPVAGYIPEPKGSGGACYLFRDGVTIDTATFHWPPPREGTCLPLPPNENVDENNEPATIAWKYARIASATRQDYVNAGGTEAAEDLHWLDVSRTLYQQAWTSDRNELISIVAKREKRIGNLD